MVGISDQFRNRRRLTQRNLIPSAITNRQISNDTIKNTNVAEEDAVAFDNGTQLNITSTVASTVDADIRVATNPYMISIFKDSITAANHVPFGANGDNDIFRIIGPMAIPQITGIGHDGNNAIFKTAIYNNTGGSATVIIVTQSRFIVGVGGGL